ncbi:hypothetical protein [Brevundimonas sp. GN22]
MKKIACIVLFGIWASAAEAGCNDGDIRNRAELWQRLTQRSVDIVSMLAVGDPTVEGLIAPEAKFSLGAGDVGEPLGNGLAGAAAFSTSLNAASYQIEGWDSVPFPVENPCARHIARVTFYDATRQNGADVKLSFEQGRLIEADGWWRSYSYGTISR